jgi:hypothetical protein
MHFYILTNLISREEKQINLQVGLHVQHCTGLRAGRFVQIPGSEKTPHIALYLFGIAQIAHSAFYVTSWNLLQFSIRVEPFLL